MSDSEPQQFDRPEPEVEGSDVVCAGCGESSPVDEMGVTADETIENEDGAILRVKRYYIHADEECMHRFISTDTDRSDGGER
jgi:hypothetical protein